MLQTYQITKIIFISILLWNTIYTMSKKIQYLKNIDSYHSIEHKQRNSNSWSFQQNY